MAAPAGSDTFDEPPWTAKWCWTASRLPRPWNTYAFFRLGVDLPARATSAVIRISADARYILYVNGRRIHQGPARCFPHHQAFDTLDLADFLSAGPNAICAIVHQPGVPTAQSVYRDASGFLLDGIVQTHAGSVPLHTPDAWRCRDALGWRKHVARTTPDLGFQEHFDADADPPDWTAPGFAATDEGGWKAPVVVASVGGYPWVTMTPRQAPLLTDEIIPFATIVSQFTGENARGYKVAEDVCHLFTQETRRKSKSPFESPEALLLDDDQNATLPPPPDGHFHLAVLDLAQVYTGHMILDLADAAGDEIIDILYLRDIEKGGAPVPWAGETALGDRYRCRPGPQRWEAFWPKAFRYVALIFRNVEQPLKIRHVGVRAVHADLARLGAFETSDETLTAVYNAGLATLRAGALDAQVDSPDLSQSQHWTAADVAFRASACAFGDLSLLERGIVQLAQSQANDGSLHSHPPSDDPHGRAPLAMFAWIATLWQHYLYFGQTNLLRLSHATLKKLLTFFNRLERQDGLIAFEGVSPCQLNLLYLQSLRTAIAIEELLDADAAPPLSQRAEELAQSLDHFFDPKSKTWRDELNANGAPGDQISAVTNALAILLGLQPESHEQIARDVVLKSLATRRGKIAPPSRASAAHCIDALLQVDMHSQVVDLIRTKWGGMIERGATTFWENWDGVTGSRCHAPASAPVYLLPQLILGVTSEAPGWRRVRIAPVVDKLEYARGTVPSPQGPIRVEWERAGEDQLAVRVELPENVEALFVGPLGENRQLDSGTSEFHT